MSELSKAIFKKYKHVFFDPNPNITELIHVMQLMDAAVETRSDPSEDGNNEAENV